MKYFSESLKSMAKILFAMYGITAVLLFFLAIFVQKLGWEAGMISIGISSIYVAACFVGGFFIGKVQTTKKFIWGILMSLAYVIITVAISLTAKHGLHSTMSTFIMNLLLCISSGMLGGMIS